MSLLARSAPYPVDITSRSDTDYRARAKPQNVPVAIPLSALLAAAHEIACVEFGLRKVSVGVKYFDCVLESSYFFSVSNPRSRILEKLLVAILLLRWSRGRVLAFGTQVRGFKPGRSRRTFQDVKILSTPSFGTEVKSFIPCRRFTTCKRSMNVTWKSGNFRQNSSAISRPSSSYFHY